MSRSRSFKLGLAGIVLGILVLSVIPTTAMAHHASGTVTITSPSSGSAIIRGASVNFTATLNQCSSASWTFGDGATGTGTSTTHTYAKSLAPGTTLTVRATGAVGQHCASPTHEITLSIVNVLPTASLSVSASPVAGETITFSGAGSSDADGTVAGYRFTIDGVAKPQQASSTLSVNDITTAGEHTVSLVVVDNDGGESSLVSQTFTVSPGPLATIVVTPDSVVVPHGVEQEFTATGADAYGNSVTFTPTWSATCGSIDATGVFTAPNSDADCTVTATSGSVFGTSSVKVRAPTLPVPQLPTLVLTSLGLLVLVGVAGWTTRRRS